MDGPLTTTTARAVLAFGDDAGMVSSFSVPRARLGKTAEEAAESMRMIVDSGALCLPRLAGPATKVKGAKIVRLIRTRVPM